MHTVIHMPNEGRRPFLERMVFSGIVFNMSWEDPEMDRQAFQLTGRDRVVSITSAGCNPLNFLCASPKQVICVDGNPAQNAILELKLAAIAELDYERFFDIFAARQPSHIEPVYANRLRRHLSATSRDFWDRNLKIAARGLYNYGRTGLFCRILRGYLRMLGFKRSEIDAFFESPTLEEQREFYHKRIAPRLWRGTSKLFVAFKPLLYMAGVHPEQYKLVDGRHDMYAYIKERVEYAMTQVPIYDNYFLSVTVTGKFRGNRVPPYLLEENFETLRNNLDRVTVVNGWLGPYLDTLEPGALNKFNLLDIFDWMSPEVFEATLKSVLRVAEPDSTMIYRSGSYELLPPDSILPHIESEPELAKKLFATDRSATYGSFYIYHIRQPLKTDDLPSTPKVDPRKQSRRRAKQSAEPTVWRPDPVTPELEPVPAD